jgi:hypothetical protein
MGPKSDYTLDKVEWHTQTPGNTETKEQIHHRFRVIIDFLQENGLTVHQILASDEPITDATAILVADLTDEGRVLVEKCYHRWLQHIDTGKPPEDLSFMKRELGKLRKA